MLTLIRGLPGSGKSTIAKALAQSTGAQYVEADMFFEDADGNYTFVPALLPTAHGWCQTYTEHSLASGGAVIVSNTFTQLWEMQPYIDIAKELNIQLQVIEVHGNFGSVHGVPPEAVERMKTRWEVWNGVA